MIEIKEVRDVSEVKIIGGQRRQIRVILDEAKMAAYHLAPAAIDPDGAKSNQQLSSGSFSSGNREFLVETGGFLTEAEEVRRVVVGVFNNRPGLPCAILPESSMARRSRPIMCLFGAGPAAHSKKIKTDSPGVQNAVTLSVAKRKGTNAIEIADQVIEKVQGAERAVDPAGGGAHVTRNYGETAKEKSDELLLHMMIAIFSVSVLNSGWPSASGKPGSSGIAIPVTLSLTLAVFYLYGYTLNRITLFALIFSIGILVDDAIVVVENIVRHYHLPENRGRPIVGHGRRGGR